MREGEEASLGLGDWIQPVSTAHTYMIYNRTDQGCYSNILIKAWMARSCRQTPLAISEHRHTWSCSGLMKAYLAAYLPALTLCGCDSCHSIMGE